MYLQLITADNGRTQSDEESLNQIRQERRPLGCTQFTGNMAVVKSGTDTRCSMNRCGLQVVIKWPLAVNGLPSVAVRTVADPCRWEVCDHRSWRYCPHTIYSSIHYHCRPHVHHLHSQRDALCWSVVSAWSLTGQQVGHHQMTSSTDVDRNKEQNRDRQQTTLRGSNYERELAACKQVGWKRY